MSSPLVIPLADAVTAEINASSIGLTAERFYRPQFDLAELKTTRLSVVPRGILMKTLDRQTLQHEVGVDVALQKKLTSTDNTEIDPLMQIVQDLIDLLRLKRLTTMPQAIWIKCVNDPIYVVEHMDQQRVFTSVINLTYRIARLP